MGLREPAGSFRILLQNSPTFWSTHIHTLDTTYDLPFAAGI